MPVAETEKLKPVTAVAKHDVPYVVLAYKSDVASKTIEQWLKDNNAAVSVCIFDRGSFHKEQHQQVATVTGRHEGGIAFIRGMNRYLYRKLQMGRGKTSLDSYLVDPKS